MTEKRYSHDAIVIVDHLKEDLIYIDGKEDLLELAEYVDRLQEENEQLKHDATVLIYSNQEYRKENEQLKQENQELHKLNQEYIDSLSDEKKETLSKMLNAILGDDEE